jgi:hypothetical protein
MNICGHVISATNTNTSVSHTNKKFSYSCINETKQESVRQKATKHQQAMMHVVWRAKRNVNLQNGHNAKIKHSSLQVTSSQ